MAVIAIETSGLTGGVALWDKGGSSGEIIVGSKSTYSRRLMRSILFLLEETGVEWQALDTVAVSLGPGSFTGLRIGLATAKGLCLSTGASIIGVPTLDVLAQNGVFGPNGSLICPVIDARKGQIYCAIYSTDSNWAKRITDYLVINPQELINYAQGHERIFFLGSALSTYLDVIKDIYGDRAVIAPQYLWYPRPLLCAYLGKRLIDVNGPHDPLTLTPLYLRLSDAEEKKRANEKAT